jgi:predicted RNA binding protein YcfA (HicA-like mRNA interferase family)
MGLDSVCFMRIPADARLCCLPAPQRSVELPLPATARSGRYEIVRQKGSHRKLEAPNHPAITFAFHDNQTIRPSTVKDILCNQVGLAEQDALALL